jgi:hypothetical protein
VPTFGGFGRYHDRMQRCEDGRWRIAHRRFEGERRFEPVREEGSSGG